MCTFAFPQFFHPSKRKTSRHEGYLAKIEREEREKALKGERNDQLEPEISFNWNRAPTMIQYSSRAVSGGGTLPKTNSKSP